MYFLRLGCIRLSKSTVNGRNTKLHEPQGGGDADAGG